jgi:hypothetical protein
LVIRRRLLSSPLPLRTKRLLYQTRDLPLASLLPR